jgi:hypothetical protein
VNKLKEYLDWKSTKTLKKYIEFLKENNFITYNSDSLPKNKPLELDIIPLKDIIKIDNKKTLFTQINKDIIKTVIELAKSVLVYKKDKVTKKETKEYQDLKEMALKLFYFYNKMYNTDAKYAFPSYLEINLMTGISKSYIAILNKFFSKNKIVDIDIGEYYLKEIEESEPKPVRERNKYKPNT